LKVESESINCDHDLEAELTLALVSHIVTGEGAVYVVKMRAVFLLSATGSKNIAAVLLIYLFIFLNLIRTLFTVLEG
jgi:hypothetical protein